MPVACGDIVLLFIHSTNPPKWKRCVVACLEPTPILLLINSRLNEFVERQPERRACQVLIDVTNHPFMKRESWLDCSEPFGYPRDWLDNILASNPESRLGRISPTVRRDIIAVVTNTSLLSARKKQRIVDALEEGN
jgi:hypothetical protein